MCESRKARWVSLNRSYSHFLKTYFCRIKLYELKYFYFIDRCASDALAYFGWFLSDLAQKIKNVSFCRENILIFLKLQNKLTKNFVHLIGKWRSSYRPWVRMVVQMRNLNVDVDFYSDMQTNVYNIKFLEHFIWKMRKNKIEIKIWIVDSWKNSKCILSWRSWKLP